jgi:hypothetical protein
MGTWLSSNGLLKTSNFPSLTEVRDFIKAFILPWSEFLATDPEVRVRFPALPDFLRSSGSGTGSTQPRDYN